MYRLLVADDEMIERAVLVQLLEEELGDQCRIFQAENGREALEVYEKEKIQIAVLDIEMPGITGIEAAQRIREKDKDCCIIFLTAFDEFSYAKKAITIRALDYLLKPYDEKELLLVLDEAMRMVDEYQTEEIRKTVTETTAGSPEGEGSGSGAAVVNGTGGDPMIETRLTDLIYQYIRDNYMFDISMQEVARTMNYSEAYFCKLFKQFFGKNFTAYLTEYRIEMAKKMLQTPTVNIKEIGKAVGYADSNYFAKVFKRVTGKVHPNTGDVTGVRDGNEVIHETKKSAGSCGSGGGCVLNRIQRILCKPKRRRGHTGFCFNLCGKSGQ